jgi:hypothetical protein
MITHALGVNALRVHVRSHGLGPAQAARAALEPPSAHPPVGRARKTPTTTLQHGPDRRFQVDAGASRLYDLASQPGPTNSTGFSLANRAGPASLQATIGPDHSDIRNHRSFEDQHLEALAREHRGHRRTRQATPDDHNVIRMFAHVNVPPACLW